MADLVVTSVADRRAAIVNVIRHARRTIALSLFRCNDEEVMAELARATARGVAVEALITSRAKGGAQKLRKLAAALEAAGASVHAYSDPVVKYHAKYLIVDDGPAVVASFNFTRKCFEKTCDALVVTSSQNPRALPPPTIQSLSRQLHGPPPEMVRDPRAALQRARELAGADGVVLATGSIYLIADLLRPATAGRASML